MTTARSAIEFYSFCEKVLNIKLTLGQRVVAKTVFGDTPYDKLDEEERSIFDEIFGGVRSFTKRQKRIVCLELGRASGKTTLCSAWLIYSAVTSDISGCGQGDVPVSVVVAPDKDTAKISIRMCREMIRGNPHLEKMVVSDDTNGQAPTIGLARPDNGRRVEIKAFAASRGGSAVRGRSIISFLFDEAQFFYGDDVSYVVSDRTVYRAIKARLMPTGKALLISTPWPVETLMGELMAKNFGAPKTCAAARATTLQMRGEDKDIREMVEEELESDPENAEREFFCRIVTGGSDGFFDTNILYASVRDHAEKVLPPSDTYPTAAACDLAFKSDSSTIVIVQWDGKKYNTAYWEEMRPEPGKPLKPSQVIAHFSDICSRYNCSYITSDGHYEEAVKEHLATYKLRLNAMHGNAIGKSDVYSRAKSVLHEGLCTFPENSRFISQMKAVRAKKVAGGTLSISTPRRAGLGHGDLVSAWVLAVYELSYARLKTKVVERGTPEWSAQSEARRQAREEKEERDIIRKLESKFKVAKYRTV